MNKSIDIFLDHYGAVNAKEPDSSQCKTWLGMVGTDECRKKIADES